MCLSPCPPSGSTWVYITRLASSQLSRGSEAERTRPSLSEEPRAAHRPGPERPRLQLPRLLGGVSPAPGPVAGSASPGARPPQSLRAHGTGVAGPGPWPGWGPFPRVPWLPRAGPWVLVRTLPECQGVTGRPSGSGGTVVGRLSANSQRVAPHCWRPQSTVPTHAPSPSCGRESHPGEDRRPPQGGHGSQSLGVSPTPDPQPGLGAALAALVLVATRGPARAVPVVRR